MDVWFFLHVGGAMVLVGSLVLAATALAGTWRTDDAGNLRLGYRALLLGALPAFLVMRVAAEILIGDDQYKASEEDAWVGIGYGSSDLGLLLIIISTVLAGISVRRASAGGRTRAATIIIGIMLVLYLVTIWAMTTKPT
jgi:hypothetical protein